MLEMDGSYWQSVADTALGVAIRESTWIYPALETIHVVGIALIFGSILAYDLRILGVTRALPLHALGTHLLPWVWTGFALNVTTGTLLFVSDAAEFAANPAFRVKLVLLAAAGLNALAFNARLAPQTAGIAPDGELGPGARASAVLSIALWLAIITAGRMMAYTTG